MSEKQAFTFFSKKQINCPVCQLDFQREELQTGRGRINAGELTIELRRLYIPTQKYGVVNPLIYPILVCPNCLTAGFANDFPKFNPDQIKKLAGDQQNRETLIKNIFGKSLDFTKTRDTIEGLASYILAFACASFLSKDFSPTARRGLYALRAAWLADDLYQKSNLEYFKDLRIALYYQAFINYDICLDLQLKNIESFDGFVWMGPDVDTNYGYDGLLYMIAYLSMMHLDTLSTQDQIVKLGNIKRVLSKIFGIGKSTRQKPQVLVNYSKQLYADANNKLTELSSQGLDVSIAEEIENKED